MVVAVSIVVAMILENLKYLGIHCSVMHRSAIVLNYNKKKNLPKKEQDDDDGNTDDGGEKTMMKQTRTTSLKLKIEPIVATTNSE